MTTFKAKNFAGKIEIHRELEKVPNGENILVGSLGNALIFVAIPQCGWHALIWLSVLVYTAIFMGYRCVP